MRGGICTRTGLPLLLPGEITAFYSGSCQFRPTTILIDHSGIVALYPPAVSPTLAASTADPKSPLAYNLLVIPVYRQRESLLKPASLPPGTSPAISGVFPNWVLKRLTY